jgi:hypothetical protein
MRSKQTEPESHPVPTRTQTNTPQPSGVTNRHRASRHPGKDSHSKRAAPFGDYDGSPGQLEPPDRLLATHTL